LQQRKTFRPGSARIDGDAAKAIPDPWKSDAICREFKSPRCTRHG
jgi:hypothetical protein